MNTQRARGHCRGPHGGPLTRDFGAVVVYDMHRAMRVPRTLDKAIDCAGALFSDIVYIFIRLLSIFGVRTSN